MRINLSDNLTVEDCLQTQHTVSGRVLRTYVYHIIVFCEELVLRLAQRAVFVKVILNGVVGLRIILQCILVVSGLMS